MSIYLETRRVLKELRRVNTQWFKRHPDRAALTSAIKLILRMEKQRETKKMLPSERSELLDVIRLLQQFILASGPSQTRFAGSNLERRVYHILAEVNTQQTAPTSIAGNFCQQAALAVDNWDGVDYGELLALLADHFGITLQDLRDHCDDLLHDEEQM